MSPNIRNNHGYVEAGGENADTEKFQKVNICLSTELNQWLFTKKKSRSYAIKLPTEVKKMG